MEFETITYEVRDNVAHVHLNRPEGANAVSEAFAADFKAVMMRLPHGHATIVSTNCDLRRPIGH